MIITDILDNKYNKYLKSVYIDYELAFEINIYNLKKLKLQVGNNIDENEIENIRSNVIYKSVQKKAISYLLRKPNSISELRNKLINKGYDENTCDLVVHHLIEINYLNDEDFARRFIKDAIEIGKKGITKVRYELLSKGVSEMIIDDYLADYIEREEDILKENIYKKLGKLQDFDDKSLEKIRAYFFRKGYKLRSINNCIKEFIFEQTNWKWGIYE